LSGGVIAPG